MWKSEEAFKMAYRRIISHLVKFYISKDGVFPAQFTLIYNKKGRI